MEKRLFLKKVKRELFLGLTVLLCINAQAQNLTIFGEIRPRAEYRDGYGQPIKTDDEAGFFVQQRTRFGATFSNSLLKMQVTLQDARVWGEAAHNADNPSIGVYEAWGEILVTPGLIAKVGRQPLRYDNRKLFSPANWSNTGNAFDIAMLKYNVNDDFLVDVGFSYSNNSTISKETYYDPTMKYRFMELLWLSKKLSKDVTLTAIGVALSKQDTISTLGKANYHKHKHYTQFTMGGTFKYKPQSFGLELYLEGYYQCGKTVYKGALDKLKSYYLVANASYQIAPKFSLAAGYEYISGDKKPNNGIQRGFTHLFRGNHDFNGSMDYWNSTGNRGLQDFYGGILFDFNKKRTSIEANYHFFKTAVQVANLDGKKLGSEIDFKIKHKSYTWLSFEAGYSAYFINENVRIIKGMGGQDTRTAQWAYASMSLKPSVVVSLLSKK